MHFPPTSPRLAVAVLVAGASAALAQTPAPLPAFELERVALNPGGRETLLLGTGDLLDAKALRAGLALHYEHEPLVFTADGQRVGAYVGSRFTTHVQAAYGLTRWAELGLQLPVVVFQRGEDLSARGYAPPPTTALGAPRLQVRFGLLREEAPRAAGGDAPGENVVLSVREGAPLDLSLGVAVGLPLGSGEALTKDPGLGLSVAPSLGLGRTLGPVRLGAEVGALLRGAQVLSPASPVVADEVGSLLSLGLACSTQGEGPRAEVSVRGLVPFSRSAGALEALVGGRLPLAGRTLELSLLGGMGFGGLPGTPLLRVVAGVAWTPRFGGDGAAREGEAAPASEAPPPLLDRDGDGVEDAKDLCPDRKGAAARKGCPDTDGDGDGVLDLDDRCPGKRGLVDNQGCPR